jgi:hypothetical protein
MDDLKELYNRVFTEKGDVKLCGRDACKALIKCISFLSNVYVGNADTGFMNVDAIKKEYKRLMNGE